MGAGQGVLAGGVDQGGDTEAQHLHADAAVDHDIAGLDVGVDDAVGVRVLHRRAHLQEQPRAVAEAQPGRVRVLGDRQAFDPLHHDVREAVRRQAAVEELGDVRVAQTRQDAALQHKLLGGRGREQAATHQLDRHGLVEAALDPLAAIDLAHAALADEFDQAIGADALGRRDLEWRNGLGWLGGQEVGALVGRDQAADGGGQVRLVGKASCQLGVALA